MGGRLFYGIAVQLPDFRRRAPPRQRFGFFILFLCDGRGRQVVRVRYETVRFHVRYSGGAG